MKKLVQIAGTGNPESVNRKIESHFSTLAPSITHTSIPIAIVIWTSDIGT